MHPTSFRTGDMTIHRVVESEAPFMDAMEFLPGLTPGGALIVSKKE
jgi:hypothetical protein